MNLQRFLTRRGYRVEYVRDAPFYGRVRFSRKVVQLRAGMSPQLHDFSLAHECGHIALREQGQACGGFEEEVAATRLAVRWGYPVA